MTDDSGQSRLAENILRFCRTLRYAGLPLGSSAVVDALAAVAATGVRRRDDFGYALRAVLVKDPADFGLFDQAFRIYFRNPHILQRLLSVLEPALEQDRTASPPGHVMRRLVESLSRESESGAAESVSEIDRAGSYSATEILRTKDFEQMSVHELNEARRLLQETGLPVGTVETRRFRAFTSGSRYDLRRSMRLMLRCHGQLIQLARRQPREQPQTVVLLCDISGSMSCYSRMFLHYAHALTLRYRRVHTFVFATRLSNISRALRERNVDDALARVSTEVPDWDGGTQIAHCLQRFNVDWSRRVLGSNASLVLLCDGLERDSAAGLEFQMQRLKRSCRQLIWMNPLLRYAGFEPKASGIGAMLPHVDRFVAAHNVSSLRDLGRLLANTKSPRARRTAGEAM